MLALPAWVRAWDINWTLLIGALQLSFLLPTTTSKQGWGALCLPIPAWLLPKGDAALPQVKTGIWWRKDGHFS